MTARKHTIPEAYVHPSDPAGYLKPGDTLMAEGYDFSWCYVWYREIPGFPGYCVGSNATIWGCLKMGPGGGFSPRWRYLKPYEGGRGYLGLTLRRNHRNHYRNIHILIAEAFLGPRPPGLEVCHRDGNNLNCAVNNLRWGTHRSNIQDRDDHGMTAIGERSGNSRLTEAAVVAIRHGRRAGRRVIDLADEFGVSTKTIQRVTKEQSWRHISVEYIP